MTKVAKELRKGRHTYQSARIKKTMNSETVWKLSLLYTAEKETSLLYTIERVGRFTKYNGRRKGPS